MAPAQAPEMIEWGIAGRAIPGEPVSGDIAVVQRFRGGYLVAAVDGLGHGYQAAAAAEAAAAVLRREADQPVRQLVNRCHEALRHTRGVVLGLASFDAAADRMIWIGVGNVEGVLFHVDPTNAQAREFLHAGGGIVGYRMPTLRPQVVAVARGDTLMLATDGISLEFSIAMPAGRSLQEIADDILARFGKPTDDALIVIARYLGLQP